MAVTEIRLHGRGGQGIVVAAAIFAEAAFREGRFARAFSLFGAERRGSPVTAFIRVSGGKLMPRCRINHPDYVVSFGGPPGEEIRAGLKEGGAILLGSAAAALSLRREISAAPPPWRIFAVEAREIGASLGLIIGGLPVVNTAILGALARVTGFATPEGLSLAIERRLSHRVKENTTAAVEGYCRVWEVTAGG